MSFKICIIKEREKRGKGGQKTNLIATSWYPLAGVTTNNLNPKYWDFES